MAPRRGIDRSDPRGLRPGRERMQRAENIFEPREKNRRPPQRPVRAPRPRASVPGAQPGRRLRQLERLRCSAVWRAASAARRRSAPARGSKSLRSRCRGGNLTLSPRPTAVAADRWCGTASYPARCARRPARGGGDGGFERQPAGGERGEVRGGWQLRVRREGGRLEVFPPGELLAKASCFPAWAGRERGGDPRGRTLAAVVQIRRARRRNGGRGLPCGRSTGRGMRCRGGSSTWSSVRSPPFEFNQAQLATGGDGVEAGQGFVAAAEFLVLLPQCLLGSFARGDFFHDDAVVRVLRGPVRQPGFGSGGSRRGRGVGLYGAGAGGASCARRRVSRSLTAVTSVKVITTPSIRSSTVR